jgi:HemY protein
VRYTLLISLLALLLGAALVWMVQQQQGYLLISLGTTTIEMSFWVGAFIYVVSCILFVWILMVLRWLLDAGGIRHWWKSRRTAKHASKTAKGLQFFLDGDWLSAIQTLRQSIANSSMPQINLLFAANASIQSNQLEQARTLLEVLKEAHPESALYADLCLAEALVERLELEEAEAILTALDRDHKVVLRLLSKCYQMQSNWYELNNLLPSVKRRMALGEAEYDALQIDCYAGLLNDKNDLQVIEDIWSTIPRAVRRTPKILLAYVEALVMARNPEKALIVLTKGLKNRWHGPLVERFGRLELADATKQLATGEQWLLEHAEDPQLLLALGRICRQMGFMGKARDYMTSTIAIQPSAEAYYELAAVLAVMGDSEGSSKMHQRGLELVVEFSAD